MKTTNRYITLLLLALPLLLNSCLKDQEDKFDESASTRMQNYLTKAQQVLVSSENGWVLDYYPDRNLSMGGYCYTVQFTSGEATVKTVLDTTATVTSLYSMGTDDGPLLKFDSYNELMHFFATPTSDRYEAYDGDFEFVIDSVADDLIKVHGKRNSNVMYFHKLVGKTAKQYIADVAETEATMIVTGMEGTLGSGAVKGSIDGSAGTVTLTGTDGTPLSTSFCYTDTGIRLYQPLTVNGETVTALNYNADTREVTPVCVSGQSYTLAGTLPPDYVLYSEYPGDYWLKFYYPSSRPDSVRVTLTPSQDGRGFNMSGLNDKYTVYLNYEKSTGKLALNSQILGDNGSNHVWLCAWDLRGGGSLTWDTGAGMLTTFNQDHDHPVYTWGGNGYADFPTTDSFIFWQTDADNKSIGQFTGSGWGIKHSTTTREIFRLYYLKNLTKIK